MPKKKKKKSFFEKVISEITKEDFVKGVCFVPMITGKKSMACEIFKAISEIVEENKGNNKKKK